MKIDKETLVSLIEEDEFPDDFPWEKLDLSVIDEWRWGNVEQVTMRHKETGGLWGYAFQIQKGDHYWVSYEEEGDDHLFDLYPMEAVTVIEYKRIKK